MQNVVVCKTYVLSRVQTGKFLSQVSCARKLAGVNGVSGAIFLVQKNWCQKLAGIEHVLFQASFCRETPPLIGRSTFKHSSIQTTFLNKKLV